MDALTTTLLIGMTNCKGQFIPWTPGSSHMTNLVAVQIDGVHALNNMLLIGMTSRREPYFVRSLAHLITNGLWLPSRLMAWTR